MHGVIWLQSATTPVIGTGSSDSLKSSSFLFARVVQNEASTTLCRLSWMSDAHSGCAPTYLQWHKLQRGRHESVSGVGGWAG